HSGAKSIAPFFGANPTATTYAYILLDNNNPRKRIRIHVSAGKYGDAFTDGTLATLTLGGGTHSMAVVKEYQTFNGSDNACGKDPTASGWTSSNWVNAATPG